MKCNTLGRHTEWSDTWFHACSCKMVFFLGGGGELLFVNVEFDTNTHMLKIVYVFIAVLHWHLVML